MMTKKITVLGFLLLCVVGVNAQINKDLVKDAPKDGFKPMPHINQEDPSTMKIKQDKSTNIWRDVLDYSQFPEREDGPMNIQRYELQMENVGIKTFFQRQVALTPEDLIAGEVDVAMFGAPTGALPHSAGNMWAPAQIRFTRDYGGYTAGSFELSWVEYETLINPFNHIRAVDYGDAGSNPYNQSHTLEEIRRVTREIAQTGAIPFAVGGDHSIPNATFRGIVDVYGEKNVAFVHFDVHLDRGTGKFGAYYHSGSFMTMAVEEGLAKGEDIVQFGMGTPVFDQSEWDKVLKEGGTVYHLHEIRRDGVRETFDKMLEVLKDNELVYVSFDIDVFDMSYAPGTGSSSPTGMSPNELFPLIREFAATKTIVGIDLVEFNPFYDNKGQQTARLCRRVMLQFLTGIAMKKEGMDPKYINPRVSGKP